MEHNNEYQHQDTAQKTAQPEQVMLQKSQPKRVKTTQVLNKVAAAKVQKMMEKELERLRGDVTTVQFLTDNSETLREFADRGKTPSDIAAMFGAMGVVVTARQIKHHLGSTTAA